MEGWGWQVVHDPEVLPAVMESWIASIASGQPFEMVFPLKGADGVFRHFLTRIIPLHDRAGAVRRWVGNNIDITRQVTVERELRRTRDELEAANRRLAEREAFLSSVLASSTDCIKVLDLDGGLAFMSEAGKKIMEVGDFNQVVGCPWPDFWKGAGNAAAVAAVEGARNGRASSFIGHAETMAGTGRWWHVAVSPIPGADGGTERILSVSRDITALRESEERREHYVRIIETSTDFIGMARLDGSVFFLNDAGCRLVGLAPDEVARLRIAEFFPPDQARAIAAEILPAVERDGGWSGERSFRHFRTGELIPVLFTVFPVQDADGRLAGYGTVTRDIRAQKRAEEQQAIVNGEIAHRLKNTLAMVQSIATMTLRGTLPPEELVRFDERLQALARAHDLLHQDNWRATDLAELASGVFANLGVIERCRVSGPPVRLGARAAMSTSLLLHELSTNAIKYGALSVPGGVVDLRWRLVARPDGRDLVLDWFETGGPPVVAPTRRGFGSRLVSLGLAGTGGADLRYDPAGLAATFRADAEQIEQA
ncbi:MAG: PAS domain S-box protein [Gluconacetobacter diazotrophicus]|nr:PAS domain S-box protein [Gluconacetobacter diazotrophicus]